MMEVQHILSLEQWLQIVGAHVRCLFIVDWSKDCVCRINHQISDAIYILVCSQDLTLFCNPTKQTQYLMTLRCVLMLYFLKPSVHFVVISAAVHTSCWASHSEMRHHNNSSHLCFSPVCVYLCVINFTWVLSFHSPQLPPLFQCVCLLQSLLPI